MLLGVFVSVLVVVVAVFVVVVIGAVAKEALFFIVKALEFAGLLLGFCEFYSIWLHDDQVTKRCCMVCKPIGVYLLKANNDRSSNQKRPPW
jgi:hypothetical protein